MIIAENNVLSLVENVNTCVLVYAKKSSTFTFVFHYEYKLIVKW